MVGKELVFETEELFANAGKMKRKQVVAPGCYFRKPVR